MASRSPRAALLASGLAAFILTGCREEAAVRPHKPLFVPADGAAAYLPPLAPAWEELPPAPPAPLRRAAYIPDHGYAERAYALDQAFYDAPPDYGVYDMEGEPWAWRSDDGYLMFAEPIDVGYRYYYYEPGRDYPFFIRTPDYGYGYGVGGVLIAIYAASGDLLPYGRAYDLAPRAGRYWGRARTLYSSARIRPEPVVYETWLARRPLLASSRDPWMRAALLAPEWRGYRERHGSGDLRHFNRERERRIAQVERLERREIRQALRREEPVRVAPIERERGPQRRLDRDEQGRRQEARRDEGRVQRAQDERRASQVRHERQALRREEQVRAASIERERGQQRRQLAEAQRRQASTEQAEVRRQQSQDQREARRSQARAERSAREQRPERPAAARTTQAGRSGAVRDMQPPAQRVERRAEHPQRVEAPARPERQARADRIERQARAEAPRARPDRSERQSRGEGGAAHDRGR